MKLTANLKKAPIGPLLVIRYLNLKVPVEWGNETRLLLENAKGFASESFIFRYLCLKTPGHPFFGSSLLQRCEVDSWITFSLGPLSCERKYFDSLNYLNTSLSSVTYLVGNVFTAADIAVWAKLAGNKNWNSVSSTEVEVPTNVHRWFSLIGNLSVVKDVLIALPSDATTFEAKDDNLIASRKEEGKFVELPGAESGKVIVRFPPEASGYLHIGHAKAALLNQYYRDAFKGKLIMRFDDTNPAKEKVDFEKVILEDLKLLKIDYEIFSHTSDHFDLLLDKCEQLLKSGKAYVDDTDPEIMKQEREQKLESKNRNNSVEKNLAMWSEMKSGSEKGQKCCVRAKIDMQSLNGCMRDPTIYRCKNEPHPKTGSKYRVYPTYDFACPIVDSIEGVTHSLRTMEYHDRDEQFYWFTDALELRKPYIWEYSRLNMTNTVLSKRKLTWFVENGYVDGWDDPRMPTVRGVLRRGMTVEGLKQFITAQGSSRSVVFMEWDKIWAINKKVIDPVAPRYTAVDAEHKVPIVIQGVSEQEVKAMKHPKNPDVGEKTIWLAPKIWIDEADAVVIKEGENVTLINWGNVTIKTVKKKNNKIEEIIAAPNFEDKNYKKTLKLTWLSDTDKAKCIDCICVYYDFLISKPILGKDEDFKNFIKQNTKTEVKMIGDPELASVKKSDIIQLQRKGFFICDVPYSPPSIHSGKNMPIVLFYIPDGHLKELPTSIPNALKDKEEKTITKPVIGESNDVVLLNNEIIEQGNKVRNAKLQKVEKKIISDEVSKLLKLKELFKTMTGQDWKPGLDLTKCVKKESEVLLQTESNPPQDIPKIHADILEQGNKVRKLKDQKADKKIIGEEVSKLLKLKELFKTVTGDDWKPDIDLTKYSIGSVKKESEDLSQTESNPPQDIPKIHADILEQGNKVRKLKDQKADKKIIGEEVGKLLKLKELFKTVIGEDWKPDIDLTKYSIGSVKKESEVLLQTEPNPPQDTPKIHADILEQGNKVRKLKDQKADKKIIGEEVSKLLKLKELFKTVTGDDWKPDIDLTKYSIGSIKKESEVLLQTESEQLHDALKVHGDIFGQGNKVRTLKDQKADKKIIGEEVSKLLKLKELFKTVTGDDWKPDIDLTKYSIGSIKKESKVLLQTESKHLHNVVNVLADIVEQGNTVRKLKDQKADKQIIGEEVSKLLKLKELFKTVTGDDWKPDLDLTKYTTGSVDKNSKFKTCPLDAIKANEHIQDHLNYIRELELKNVQKELIDEEIEKLFRLKDFYKTVTGQDWKPGIDLTKYEIVVEEIRKMYQAETVQKEIIRQADMVRELKQEKAEKSTLEHAINLLLKYKGEYKRLTGKDYVGENEGQNKKNKPKKEKSEQTNTQQNAKKKEKSQEKDSSVKKVTRLGIEALKEENLPDWYSQVIVKGELIEYYDVSGCYILRPWSFAIWEALKDFFDKEIKLLGVKNCYFPIFVSRSVLEKEKSHIADFAPEVAWVTKSGDSDLAEHIAIRPTSETVMYPAYAKWIQSYRDLPIKLNQWNNVVRWEFKHPQPFLRTREFLWQEGHTAYAEKEEAEKEVEVILDLYGKIYTELLSIPVVKGRKTEKEKFAGGDYTLTVEAYISASGRAIQGATSHHLGQNFSKMFDIVYEDPETQEKKFVYQNSWGFTTRTIGVMIMVHADNKGLVLPPRVAAVQVVIVPCGITASLSENEKEKLLKTCRNIEVELKESGIRVEGDYRDNYSPGWKFNNWELKGVPIRVEVGPKDLQVNQVVTVRRDTGARTSVPMSGMVKEINSLLENIQESMLKKSTDELNANKKLCTQWDEFCQLLDQKCLLLSPFCGEIKCEEEIKEGSTRADADVDSNAPSMGAKSLCIPLEQPEPGVSNSDKCINPKCCNKPKFYTLFGRSY